MFSVKAEDVLLKTFVESVEDGVRRSQVGEAVGG